MASVISPAFVSMSRERLIAILMNMLITNPNLLFALDRDGVINLNKIFKPEVSKDPINYITKAEEWNPIAGR